MVEISRMGGLTSANAVSRASDTVGLKPWRLAGATSPRVATGSTASAPTSKDAGLGAEVVYVFERYTGLQPAASSAPVNAKMVPPMRLVLEPSIIRASAMALTEANF